MSFAPLIAIPSAGAVHADLVNWLIVHGLPTAVSVGSPVDHNRNCVIRRFLEEDFTHIFFLDDDVVPPHDVLPRLRALDCEVATGLYPLWLDGRIVIDVNFPTEEIEDHTLWPSPWPTGVREVSRAGMGCCLIKREVFMKIEDPWFQFVLHGGGRRTGEDVRFFQQVRKAGMVCKMDGSIRCSHFRGPLDLKIIADLWAEKKGEAAKSGLVPVMEL